MVYSRLELVSGHYRSRSMWIVSTNRFSHEISQHQICEDLRAFLNISGC
jgi:hypothetical protein